VADRQTSLLDDMSEFCEKTLAEDSIYAFLHRERDRLFPDEAFADLFADDGRRSVLLGCSGRDGAPTLGGLV